MNKTTEALKLAEEALKCLYNEELPDFDTLCKALAAIREALADHSGDATEMVAEPVQNDDWKKASYMRENLAKEAEPVKQEHTEQYWLHEINNARSDGYERGYAAGKSEPVKQEPVASPDKGLWEAEQSSNGNVYLLSDDFEHDVTMVVKGDFAGDKLDYATRLAEWMNYHLQNTAPVDAKAIRAEALEEAAKVCDANKDCKGWGIIAAAIREMK